MEPSSSEAFFQGLMKQLTERDKLIEKLVKKLDDATTTTTEKRTLVAVPALNGEGDLEVWESQIRASLAPDNLFRYLEKDIPEPEDQDSTEWKRWKTDRQDIFKLLTASLKKASVMSRMTRIGWKPDDVDPRRLYLKAFEALQHGTEETLRMLTYEFFTMTPKKFDSMDAYISRVCVLRQRQRTAGLEHPLKTDLFTVLTAIKPSHSEIYERCMAKIEENDLKWDDFIKELTEKCVDTDINKLANTAIKIDGKKAQNNQNNNKSQDSSAQLANSNSNQQGQQRIKCSVCDRMIFKGYIHYNQYGSHRL